MSVFPSTRQIPGMLACRRALPQVQQPPGHPLTGIGEWLLITRMANANPVVCENSAQGYAASR